MAFGIVNRDPAVFNHSAILDLGRHPSRRLAFGYGAHCCLGVHLARLQLDIAVNVLLNRLLGRASRSEARWGSFVRQHRDSYRAGCAQRSRILRGGGQPAGAWVGWSTARRRKGSDRSPLSNSLALTAPS